MFALFDEVPTSTSLLMQCGYRSKVCTNFRATRLDGTLHKLCEFHRRKANENQQRLHQRQRKQRVQRRRAEDAVNDRPVKRLAWILKWARRSIKTLVFRATSSTYIAFSTEFSPPQRSSRWTSISWICCYLMGNHFRQIHQPQWTMLSL
ncbi:hypothetical protein V7S43_016450 [Phytophthora oleae]|uniref:Uncharacterized protein n=1 Tax=Phytophthora oleae TaxID=2107226 RepID=A0ABD3EW78_9STRA